MMKNKKIIFVIIIAIIAIGYVVYQYTDKGPDILKIGVILPLSGDLANVGEDVRFGVNMFAEIHSDVEFIIEDDGGESKKAINALKKLTGFDNVNYILGPLGPVSSEAVYASQTSNEKDELFFVALSMCADGFKKYENMLCIYPSPYYQLKETYKYPKAIGKDSLYIIVAKDAFGESLLDMTKSISVEIGLDVVGSNTVNVKDLEFRTIARKAIGLNPKFIIVATNLSTNIKIIKSIKEFGYKGMIMSGADIEEDTVKEFQNVFEGVYITGRAKLDYNSEFLESFREKKGVEPNLYTAFGYVWSDILYELLKSGKKITAERIMNYVKSNSETLAIKGMEYNQIDKTIEFPMEIVIVRNGEFEVVFTSDDK